MYKIPSNLNKSLKLLHKKLNKEPGSITSSIQSFRKESCIVKIIRNKGFSNPIEGLGRKEKLGCVDHGYLSDDTKSQCLPVLFRCRV